MMMLTLFFSLTLTLGLIGVVLCDPSIEKHLEDTLEGDMCTNLTKSGKCESDPELMKKYCTKTYYQYSKQKERFENLKDKRDFKHINSETDESFFDLKATNKTGSMIDFDRFEGYITMVAFIPKACDGGVAADETIQTLTDIRAIWPKVVEIIAFPFEHPDSHFYATEEDCSIDHYNEAFTKQRGGITLNAMKEINIHFKKIENDKYDEPHLIYTYFKKLLNFPSISATSSTLFLVSPTGLYIEAFYDISGGSTSTDKIKKSIRQHIEREL